MSVARAIAVLVAALALVVLYQGGFEAGAFVAPLQFLIDFDDNFTRALFQWAEPAVRGALTQLNAWVGWDLQLYPHWKHVVVLLWLYFGGGAKKAWRRGYRAGALFRLAWGGAVAVPAGVAFGVIPLAAAQASMLASTLPVGGRVGLGLLSALIPVLAIVLYALGTSAWVASAYERQGRSWWDVFVEGAGVFPVIYGLVGVTSVAVAFALATASPFAPLIAALPNPGLLLLMALILGLASFLTWSDRLLERNDNLGIIMIEAFVGAVSFIIADAGWKLAAS